VESAFDCDAACNALVCKEVNGAALNSSDAADAITNMAMIFKL
jgi:hypothetical protein